MRALEAVDLEVPVGGLVGVIGPDGAGKTTLLGLVAGARRLQKGDVEVLGCDLRRRTERRRAAAHLAYMPQGLGANLYPELDVRENLTFFARLFQVPGERGEAQIARLLDATGLTKAADRRVRQLSGGMKQKLGLCCALVHAPRLIVLDEPTTGVDPLSRRAFWELLAGLRATDPELTVVVATAYMEEAEPFDDLVLLDRGRVLARGAAKELCRKTASPSLEGAYARLLEEVGRESAAPAPLSPARSHENRTAPRRGVAEPEDGPNWPPALEARSLSRRFGPVLAVDRVSFRVERGEIFGFVGPNGCGKTTTLKMLTGILPPSGGEARLLGERVSGRSLEQRRHAGYMSQSFSLYGELTVGENLRLYGHLLDVPGRTLARRGEALARHLGLEGLLDEKADALPLGMRQRLALATALIHEPTLLVLDEPTSGVDPRARETFWEIIEHLAHEDRVTVLVSTHYLTEASRCDRVALMSGGRVLACDTPKSLIRAAGGRTLEDAFVTHIRADEERTGVQTRERER